MREITEGQKEFTTRPSISSVMMLKLVLYSDRGAGTIGETFYISTTPIIYDYGNLGTDIYFWPLLKGVGDLVSTMDHLPTGGDRIFERPVFIDLANEVWHGERLSKRLQRTYRLENATVELSQILVTELGGTVPDSLFSDLSASHAGDEHTVLYRGRVHAVAPIDEERVSLQCSLDTPSFPWIRATDATKVAPKDLGVRLPIIYGHAKKVRCVSLDVGRELVLGEAIDEAFTGVVEVDDTSIISGTPNLLINGKEEVTATYPSSTTVNITGRGVNGSAAVPHSRGEIMIEVKSSIAFAAAGHQSEGVNEVYMRLPQSEHLLRLRTGDYAANNNDDAAPGMGSTPITTVVMTSTQIASVIADLAAEAVLDTESPNQIENPDGSALLTSDTEAVNINRQVTNVGQPIFAYSSTLADEEFVHMWYTALTPGTSTVVRWRPRLKFTAHMFAISFFTLGNPTTLRIKFTFVSWPGSPAPVQFNIPLDGGYAGSGIYVDLVDVVGHGPWINDGVSTLDSFEGSASTARIEVRVWKTNNLEGLQVWSVNDTFTFDATDWGIEFETLSSESVIYKAGAAAGIGVELFADVGGSLVPAVQPVGTTEEAFDSLTGWTTIGGAVASIDAADKQEGSGSLKILDNVATGGAGVAVPDVDVAANWFVKSGSASVVAADDAVTHQDGSSVRFTYTAVTTSNTTTMACIIAPVIDLSANLKALRIKVRFNTTLGTDPLSTWLERVTISLWATSISISERISWSLDLPPIDVLDLLNGDTWYTMILDPADANANTFSDSQASLAVIDQLGFAPDNNSLAHGTTMKFWLDVIETISPVSTPGFNAYKDGLVSADMDSSSYALWTKRTAGVPELRFWLSDNATGDPIPPVRREILIGFGAVDTWLDGQFGFVDIGVPDITDVQSMGIRALTGGQEGSFIVELVGGGAEDTILHLDDLRSFSLPESDYLALEGASIDHPADVIRHVIEQRLGKNTENQSLLAAQTNLGSARDMAVDLRTFGFTTEEVLARLAYETRTNIVVDESQSRNEYRVLSAGTDYKFGSSIRTIATWTPGGIAETSRTLDQLGTRFVAHYASDQSLPPGDSQFRQIVLADPSQSDVPVTTAAILTAQEVIFGRIDASPYDFLGIDDEVTAEDVLGYYVSERSRLASLFAVDGVPWWEAYDLQLGDIVSLTVPWENSGRKCRVIEYRKSFRTEQIELRLVEVQ